MSKTKLSNQHSRGSAILTTIFLLFGITAVAMIGIEIIMNGLMARRVQGASIKAFYAAESGAERSLSVLKITPNRIMLDAICMAAGAKYINFASSPAAICQVPVAGAKFNVGSVFASQGYPYYWIRPLVNGRQITLFSYGGYDIRGAYEKVSRQINITTCVPDCSCLPGCSGVLGSDGCGGTCQ